ncbi:helix-turn-helix domain-containing protein (plasmid) [Streptomyces hirsutus]|uniref:helix-turn-helix domain-containing protein n=1 Tax=Streptomyces hirsutus TaxID=35620 RepID=UPI002F913695|nr:helix-turn-helix domain-containing protein [Streptomyces hirsutus]
MPGRPEKSIPADVPQDIREFAQQLRDMRAKSGLTYRELADRAHMSPSALSRAASGASVPSWHAVESIARAVRLDSNALGPLKNRWLLATTASHRGNESVSRETEDDLNPELLQAALEHEQRLMLRRLYEQAGRPSLRTLEQRSGRSRSTVHRAIVGHSLAGATDIVNAMLRMLSPDERATWNVTRTEDATEGSVFTVRPRDPDTEDAVLDFLRMLRRVRNLVAHGELELKPMVAAQIMQLSATIEAAERQPSSAGDDPASSTSQTWTGTVWQDVEADSIQFKDFESEAEAEGSNSSRSTADEGKA